MAKSKNKRGQGTTTRYRVDPQLRQLLKQQYVAVPDAINETLRTSGHLQRIEAEKRVAKADRKRKESDKRAQVARRNSYRKRKAAEQAYKRQAGQNVTELPAALMTDQMVDAAIAQEQREAQWSANQPQFTQGRNWSSYSPEARHAMGYYTPEEREYAAQLNDMRSNTIFGNVMPNFGHQAAYNNPAAEFGAFRGTATYLPDALVSGMGFGLPSATTATANGLRTGWQTARTAGANLGQSTRAAVSTAVRQAAPVVTNPRWATTTATVAAPMAAAAQDGSEQNEGFLDWVTGHPMESILIGGLAFKGGKGLFNRGRRLFTVPSEPTEGRPASFTEAMPERGTGKWTYNPAERPPSMKPEPVLEDYRMLHIEPDKPRPIAFSEPEPPKPTRLRPKKKKGQAQWDAQNRAHQEWETRRNQYEADNAELNKQWSEYDYNQQHPQYNEEMFKTDHDNWSRTAQADYDAAMKQHQADVEDYNAEKAKLDQEYDTAVNDYNQRKAANEQAWKTYHESDPYKKWLKRKNRVQNFKDNFKNSGSNLWKNYWKNFYITIPGTYVGYKFITKRYSDQPQQAQQGVQKGNVSNKDSVSAVTTNSAVTQDSVVARPYIDITPDGRAVVQGKNGEPNDTIVLKTYEVGEFED